MRQRSVRRGAALMIALVTLMVVMLLTAAALHALASAHRQARLSRYEMQAAWLAEAGLARAAARLARQGDYTGETWRAATSDAESAETMGIVKIEVQQGESTASERRIAVTAQYPDHPIRRATVVRERKIIWKPDRSDANE